MKVARRFVAARPDASRAEIAGALLHDVGKIECGLGTWGRVAASVVGGRTERFRTYHEHEHIGSVLAERAGSDPATVELIDERGPAYDTLEAVRSGVIGHTASTRAVRRSLTTARMVIQTRRPPQMPAMPRLGTARIRTAIGSTAIRYPNAARPRNA